MKSLLPLLIFLPLFVAPARESQPRLVADRSSVSYRLVHPLHTIDATSREVAYRVAIDEAKREITSVEAQADVTTFDSGNSNRDSHAMEVIDALSYPDVHFASTAVTARADSIEVAGTLTFHGVTRPITMEGVCRWTPDTLEVRGAFDLSLTAFKIERPSLLMIPVRDTLNFFLTAVFTLK